MSVKTVESWSAQFPRVYVEMLSGPEAFRVLCLSNSLLTSPRAETERCLLEVGAAMTKCSTYQICCKKKSFSWSGKEGSLLSIAVQLVGKGGITVVVSRSAGRERRDHCCR